MNLWPNGNSLSPSTTGTRVIRYAGGQLTVFDYNGNPLQVSLPPGVTWTTPLSLLGKNPAPALLSGSVVCSVVTVTESGTINVTVGGIGFTASYGAGSTANNIASALAGEMNYPLSPVSATVTGTTITITSTINGAATNYPLSVSSTYNPQCITANSNGQTYCFTSPGIIGTASGSMTGGTD